MPDQNVTVGILGGGQLARMSAYAAYRLGLRVAVVERAAASPAGQITPLEFVGEWDDAALLDRFAAACDVITLENEFIDAAILARLEGQGRAVHPGSATLARIQDKLVQKQTLAAHGLPLAPFREVAGVADGSRCGNEWGYPFVLKARRNSYDGYGNRTIASADGLEAAMGELGHPRRALYAEAFIPFRTELATLVARGRDGAVCVYPVVETRQERHICKWVLAPAPVEEAVRRRAQELAEAAIAAVEGVGIFGVEFFLNDREQVLINELAPRPHNTGHYSIEACHTSQFENHLRAVLGWPLGDPRMIVPAAAMVNLLGKRAGPVQLTGLPAALRNGAAKVHIYGKAESRVGRKLGHVTVVGDDARACLQAALAVDAALIL
jgi:5-(carboxyamino)imidazole ribonucleotide synthase